MSYFRFVFANLFRKPTRSILTVLSIMVAFMLFGLLRTVAVAFEGGVSVTGANRLIVSSKYSIITSLPYKQKQQILALDDVTAIAVQSWFGGVYQDPTNFFPTFPVEPLEFFNVYSEFEIAPEQLAAFQNTRTGAVAPKAMLEKYGWAIGDTIPLNGTIYPQDNGSRLWEFELVGSFSAKEGSPQPSMFIFQHEYFDEATAFGSGSAGWFTVVLKNQEAAPEVASQIDAMFENSSDPTKTATEAEFSRRIAKQLGNISLMMTTIIGAVFFTIILLTANTMVQAFRERTGEFAVLKTLGFRDSQVLLMVLGEGVLLCVLGGLLGLGLALLAANAFGPTLSQFVGIFEITSSTIVLSIVLAAGLGVFVSTLPALAAKRLTIVEALRGH